MSGCLELKIVVRYEGLKATQYFSKFTNRSDDVFREDLLALRLPHPKRENTTFVSHGCVECVWPLVPKNGILHKQVMTKTNPSNHADREAYKSLIGKLSISNIAVKEIYPEAYKGRKNLKRPNPSTSERLEEGSFSRLPRYQGNGYQPSSSTGTRPLHVSEAEAFLQDMSESFRPHKMLKIEPVDVPLPPRSFQTSKLHRSSSSSISSHLSSTSKATNPPQSTSSSSSRVSQKLPQVKVASSTPTNHMPPPPSKPLPPTTPISEPISIPAPILEMLRELQPLLSKPQLLQEPAQRRPIVRDQNMAPPIPTQPEPPKRRSDQKNMTLPMSSQLDPPQRQSIVRDQNMAPPIPTQPEPPQRRSDQKNMTLPMSSQPEPGQRQSIVRDQNKTLPIPTQPEPSQRRSEPIPTQPKAFEATTTGSNGNSRPDASDVPEIQRLTRESCDLRRQINADSVRDASIILKLKQLNAAFIPGPLKTGTDSIMEGRIRKLEQDLESERKMRLEAEDVVRDIRRECKAPFIVPGLLDAFIKLSRLTTQATRLNGTVTKDNG